MRTRLLFFALLPVFLGAQNLVVNPGFETHGAEKPFTVDNGFTTLAVEGWYMPTHGSSDYFLCEPNRYDVSFMQTIGGSNKPHGGNSCVGFFGSLADGTYREYVGGSLAQPMTAGKTYAISFALSLGSRCNSGVTELGMYFSATQDSEVTTQEMHVTPQVKFSETGAADLSGQWKMMTATYTAKGGERFFIFGNFVSKEKQQLTTISPGMGRSYAYYFTDDVSITENGAPVVKPELKIEPGQTLVYRNIYFQTDRSILLAESYPPLYSILAALKAQPDLKVQVCGHTDTTGGAVHNQKLSEARAKAVADFLISNGIAKNRVTYIGYGSSKPVSSTDNALNRRVEFVFSE